jgi:N,N'-diacetyllegionaminate synthase
MAKTLKIGDRLIGGEEPSFVIAEAGANHNGDLGMAKELCRKAKEAGCDSVKFQTFSAESFCVDKQKMFTYFSQGQEVAESEFALFKRLEFTSAQWVELMAYCDEIDILFFTTIQDPPNLDMMLELGLKAIKVGSDDFTYLQNLEQYAQADLPLILSKGMSDLLEVDRVVRHLSPLTDKLAILHCVSLYPTDPKLLNINQIPALAARYPDIVWGFSDHSQGTLASTMAVTLGAKIIEKHFTLDHDLPGPDHWFSMNPAEMANLVESIRFAEDALGTGEIAPSTQELEIKKIMRRRAIARHHLSVGTKLDDESVDFKRADAGCFVEDWEQIQGKTLRVAKIAGEGIDAEDVDPA